MSATGGLKPGQVYDNGKVTLVGRYNVQIRNAYMYYRVERYLIDHPEATRKQAGQMARHAWRLKAKASMKVPVVYEPGTVGHALQQKALHRD